MYKIIKAGLVCITIISAGCSTTQTNKSQQPEEPSISESASSVSSLLQQAGISTDPVIRTKLQLQAAELMRQNNQLDQANIILSQVDYPAAPQNLQEQYMLIALWIAIEANNLGQIEQLLSNIPDRFYQQTTIDIQRKAGELKAQGYDLTNQHFYAAKERINSSALYSGDEYWGNHELIWKSLSKTPTSELSQQQATTGNYELNGWLQLATSIKQNQISLEQQLASLSQWLTQWPAHPAALRLPEELELLSTLPERRPDSIALALPLSGALGKAGQAIRDGFLATYYADKYHTTGNTEITLYDTNQKSFVDVYQEILSNEPDLIIGPLDKGSLLALEKFDSLAVPVLALNYLSNDTPPPFQLYQFGLSAEDEARQLVNKMWSTGARQVITIMPESDWGQRVFQAFSQEWTHQNGEIVDSAFFKSNNLSNIVESLLAVDKSKQRARQVRNTVVESLEFTPRRRQDIDAIVLISKPETARQLKPLLSFHYASNIPIYSTSHIYSGSNSPQKNSDLNGIKFIETPWVLSKTNAIKHQIHQLMPRRAQYYDRLFALGADTYTLAPRLILLERIEGSQVNGQTGLLSMNSKKQITRTLDWARFVNGEARAER